MNQFKPNQKAIVTSGPFKDAVVVIEYWSDEANKWKARLPWYYSRFFNADELAPYNEEVTTDGDKSNGGEHSSGDN